MRVKEGGVVGLQRPTERLSSTRESYPRSSSVCSNSSTYGRNSDKYERSASACGNYNGASTASRRVTTHMGTGFVGSLSKRSGENITKSRPSSEKCLATGQLKNVTSNSSKCSNITPNGKLMNVTNISKEDRKIKMDGRDPALVGSSKLLNINTAKSPVAEKEEPKKKIDKVIQPVEAQKSTASEIPGAETPSNSQDTQNEKSAMDHINSRLSDLNISDTNKPVSVKLNIPLPSGEEHYYSNESDLDEETKIKQDLEKLEIRDRDEDEEDEDDDDLVAKSPGKNEKIKQRLEPYPSQILLIGHHSGGGWVNDPCQIQPAQWGNERSNVFDEVAKNFYLTQDENTIKKLEECLILISSETPSHVEDCNSPGGPLTREEPLPMWTNQPSPDSPGTIDCSENPPSIGSDSGISSPPPGSISPMSGPVTPSSAPLSPYIPAPKRDFNFFSHQTVQPDAKILIEEGLEIPADKRLETKMSRALLNKYWKEYCVLEEADLKQCNENGDTILMTAVQKIGQEPMLERIHVLIERIVRQGEGDLFLLVNRVGQSALTLAAMEDPLAARLIVDAIVKLGKHPDKLLDGRKHRLVHTLIRYGDEKGQVLAELLNAKGTAGERVFPVDDVDDNGKTPLLVAAETHSSRRSTIAVTKLLIKHGANIRAQLKDKKTALHLAVKHSCDCVLIKVLLQNVSSQIMHLVINACDEDNNTPLHLATKRKDLPINKQIEVIELLKSYKAKNNIFDSNGKLPLSYFNPDRNA